MPLANCTTCTTCANWVCLTSPATYGYCYVRLDYTQVQACPEWVLAPGRLAAPARELEPPAAGLPLAPASLCRYCRRDGLCAHHEPLAGLERAYCLVAVVDCTLYEPA